jgi:hypothetical protein
MTKQRTLFAASATAMSAFAFLTFPAVGQALPMVPLAPECEQYVFTGLNILNQSNGYRREFNADGPTVDAPVTSFNNRQAVAGRGQLTGGITGREVSFSVIWDNGVTGDYSGSVSSSGKARGDTSSPNAGGSASWNFKNRLNCAVELP